MNRTLLTSASKPLPSRGFTLIELLVVIVIIGVLASVVGPRLFGRADQGKIAAARAQIENFSLALDNYQLDTGNYPSSQQGLAALLVKPMGSPAADGWRGPYLRARAVPQDPWGKSYQYISPGKLNISWYDLMSFGKDGQSGGEGDASDIGNF